MYRTNEGHHKQDETRRTCWVYVCMHMHTHDRNPCGLTKRMNPLFSRLHAAFCTILLNRGTFSLAPSQSLETTFDEAARQFAFIVRYVLTVGDAIKAEAAYRFCYTRLRPCCWTVFIDFVCTKHFFFMLSPLVRHLHVILG